MYPARCVYGATDGTPRNAISRTEPIHITHAATFSAAIAGLGRSAAVAVERSMRHHKLALGSVSAAASLVVDQ